MPAVCERAGRSIGGSGHWVPSLLEDLVRTPGIQVEVATAYPGMSNDEFEKDGVRYFVFGQPRVPGFFFASRKKDLESCARLVSERAPDIVHIHGTERFFGLISAREMISVPTVISLQGLLQPYVPAFFGALSIADTWRINRFAEFVTGRGMFWLYRGCVRGAKREQEILAGAQSFMGRTDWDRAHAENANPDASYYQVGETLRRPFRKTRWNLSRCERHSVIFTNAGEPRRGTEVLLQAMLAVRREFPDAKLRLAGNIGTRTGYSRFLRRAIVENDLSRTVEFLGYLDANAMADELCRSHVFALSSYIENSPNSLCEAMQVGLPCVASYAGGIPSLVDQGRTGLLFPVGDAPLLADSIMRIFRDDDFAFRLGAAARAEASARHSPERVLAQVLDAYRNVIGHDKESLYSEALARS